jgi:uncharacterized membrane protein
MTNLIAAAMVFFAIHIFISGTRIRDVLVGALGERAYMGLFSLASLAVIVWMAIAFNHAGAEKGSDADPLLYDLGLGARHAAILLVAIAFLLGVPGLLTPNPTSVRGEALAAKPDAVKGVLRITRHPFLWGVALWSAVHLANNGDAAGVIFFGTFFLLAVFGTLSIDAKRRRKLARPGTASPPRLPICPLPRSCRGAIAFAPASILTGVLLSPRSCSSPS